MVLTKVDIIIAKRVLWKKRYVIAVFIIGLVAGIAFSVYLISGLAMTRKLLIQKNAQVTMIRQKVNSVNETTVAEMERAGKSIEVFMPREFDLFSMISFIDAVSRKTNLRVGSIVLTQHDGAQNKVAKKEVNVLGDMTFEEFLSFLQKYKYVTGRLFSIRNVNITTLDTDSIKLSAEIFAYNPSVNVETLSIGALTDKERSMLEKIISSATITEQNIDVNDDYSSKDNPFE